MKKYNSEGVLIAEGYFTKKEIIKKGEYKKTSLDTEKQKVDFLITFCGKRYEVIFNHDVEIQESFSIRKDAERRYLVTEKGLEYLKGKYTYACDF